MGFRKVMLLLRPTPLWVRLPMWIGSGLVEETFGNAEKARRWLHLPSVIIPMASNLLLNPRYPAAGTARAAPPQPFRFDARLWTT